MGKLILWLETHPLDHSGTGASAVQYGKRWMIRQVDAPYL